MQCVLAPLALCCLSFLAGVVMLCGKQEVYQCVCLPPLCVFMNVFACVHVCMYACMYVFVWPIVWS